MKKITIFLLIFLLTGCTSRVKKNSEISYSKQRDETFSCVKDELDKIIGKINYQEITEDDLFHDNPQNKMYFKGAKSDGGRYLLIDTGIWSIEEQELIYKNFIQDEPVYQSFSDYFIKSYIITPDNEVDINSLKEKCDKNMKLPIKGRLMPQRVLNKLDNTKKIKFIINKEEIGEIKKEENVEIFKEAMKYSRMREGAYTCEGTIWKLELYNKNNELIETMDYYSNSGFVPKSTGSSGCGKYNFSKKYNLNKIITEETGYIFWGLESNISDEEDREKVFIYEDNNYKYYTYNDLYINFYNENIEVKIKYALDNNYITFAKLYDQDYYTIFKEEK